jgi:hypothetical protein
VVPLEIGGKKNGPSVSIHKNNNMYGSQAMTDGPLSAKAQTPSDIQNAWHLLCERAFSVNRSCSIGKKRKK